MYNMLFWHKEYVKPQIFNYLKLNPGNKINDKENINTSLIPLFGVNNNTINHIVCESNIVMIQISLKDF